MKKRMYFSLHLLVLTGVFMSFISSCKDDNGSLPVLVTSPVNYISEQSVTCNGNVIDDGGTAITKRGICWGGSHNPTTANDKMLNGSGTGSFICTIEGLLTNTQYYMRAYAVNSAGTGYGNEITFRTWNAEMVIDFDGNLYHTVTIGSQVWLVENLKVTHYRDGDPIELVTDNQQWEGLTSGAYCNYDNSSVNVVTYGRLYNWFAVNDPRNIAPADWHVSSDQEWSSLSDHLGGNAVAGGKLKEAGFLHWSEPNTNATNETGFSALPGGHRVYSGNYAYINLGGGWWCSTKGEYNDAWIRYMDYGAWDTWRYLEDKRYGRSVRCLKN